MRPMNRTDFGDKFIRLIELYRKPDGSKWSMAEIEEGTGGFVKAPYLTNLKANRIKQPGLERLRAIARVMGFPPELWLQSQDAWKPSLPSGGDESQLGSHTLARRLNILFDVLTNERTGKPFTNRDVAELSMGRLTEEEVAAAREAKLDDLKGAQYLALSDVFDVDVSYWYQGAGPYRNLTEEEMRAIADPTTHEILTKVYRSSERQKDVILHLLEQLELMRREDREDR